MFVICDQNDVVQDISSRQENLSRGFGFPGYMIYKDIDADVRILDTFDGVTLTPNTAERQKAIDKAANEKKIADKIRADAIADLISTGDLPEDYK